MKFSHYQLLAEWFRYPEPGFVKKAQRARDWLKTHCPSAAEEAETFYKDLSRAELDQIQVLFTRTFDIQAVTTLDAGYVLFGDDYKRGEILSNLNREHQKAGNNCGSEIADHLPNLLCLIPKLKDEELLRELVEEFIAPAVRKMVEEFNPEKLTKKNELYKKHYKTLIEIPGNNNTVYQCALKALYLVLQKDFDVKEKNPQDYANNDFLRAVSTEMDVEKVATE